MEQTYSICWRSVVFAQVCPHIWYLSAPMLQRNLSASPQGICVADLRTRSELLESTLPAPVMSTSPSGLNQAEEARPSHPENVQAFDVAPIVHAYLASLPATPERFKLPDAANFTVHRSTSCMQPPQCKCMTCYVDLI